MKDLKNVFVYEKIDIFLVYDKHSIDKKVRLYLKKPLFENRTL